jgi:hypothetical protein
MELFKMLGFAPDASWGQGGAPSAADRGLMLQPLVEYTASKQLNWEAGLGRMFAMAYQMIEGKMAGKAVYRGSVQNKYGGKRQPFSFEMGPGMPAADVPNPDSTGGLDSEGDPGAGFDGTDFISLPQDPKQLFDGDYDVRFSWNNRIDADDPSYALAEVNKFTSGVQSLETTLERLGVESPEDEMRRMENEADRFPWINQGLIKLITAQIAQSGAAQGQGGGNPGGDQQQQAMDAASTSASDQSGSLNADAANQGIGPGVSGFQYGGAGQ